MLREDYNLPLVKSFEISEMSLSDLQEVLEIENLSFATPWSKELFLKEIRSEFSKNLDISIPSESDLEKLCKEIAEKTFLSAPN